MFIRVHRWMIALVVLSLATSALAVEPGEVLTDPALESRARAISQDLRCLVCQNQSIDDSNADLARDLRVLVRERLQTGDSDAAVRDYVVSRYGDFVLLKPPFKLKTVALWLSPAVILLGGLAAVVVYYRRRRESVPEPEPLTSDERLRLARLTQEDAL